MWFKCWIFVLAGVITTTQAITQTPKCDDVDTAACQLLQARRPDFCKDEALVRSICPRFCKLCPIECYHCDTTYKDFHQCNTTVLCQSGEVCMRKELISFLDGHHEYEMTCQDRMICDGGSDLTIPFGKRHVNSRDISVTCCVDDLCNYPEITTTTPTTTTTTTYKPVGCPKDIIFMVDVASHVLSSEHDATNNLIASLVHRLDIGLHDNMVALYTFDRTLHTKFEIYDYTDKTSLLSEINTNHLYNSSSHFRRPNTTLAIQAVISHLTHYYHVDRSTYPDAVVIIGSAATTSSLRLSSSDLHRLEQLSRDVIVLDVGSVGSAAYHYFRPHDGTLATDSNHIINADHLIGNTKTIVDKLFQLITSC